MMNASRKTLLLARKEYSRCAAAIEAKIGTVGLTPDLSEQIIGVGVAADWVRRASEMESILYIGKGLNDSQRKTPFVDILRYGFGWFGLNAVFSRPALLHVVGMPSNANSEFEHFRVLFDAAALANSAARTAALHAILATPTAPRLPNHPMGTSVSTLFAVDAKYVPAAAKQKGAAKLVAAAASSGNLTGLDLPRLLYAFRNWSVHGNALDGGFGSRPRFANYVGILLEALAEIHLATGSTLRSKL
jgi:hypothetical protein